MMKLWLNQWSKHCLLALPLLFSGQALADTALSLPENPAAIENCIAMVRVEAVKLRAAPSLSAEVLGFKHFSHPVKVIQVHKKWAEVEMQDGRMAYIASYLLSFPNKKPPEQSLKNTPIPKSSQGLGVRMALATPAFPSTSHFQ